MSLSDPVAWSPVPLQARTGLVRFVRHLPEIAVIAASVLLPMVMALAAPINHDEDQYVAAALLVPRLAIYRDFASLQTPLHAYLFAPLGLLRPHAFFAMRMATATLATLLLGLVYLIQRRQGVSRVSAMVAMGLLLCCTSFHIGASLVRNDVLPALLATIAMGFALEIGQRRGAPLAVLAGACIGLAISTKVSFAPFAPGLCLALVFRQARGWRLAIAAACGVAIGVIPAALPCWRAPGNFWWGVVQFGRSAPFQFYSDRGDSFWLSITGKLVRLFLAGVEGPGLAAAVITALAILRSPWERMAGRRAILLAFIIAGIIAAWLPTPSWRQYLLPLLPVLFVAFGLALDRHRLLRDGRIRSCMMLFAAIGLARPVRDMVWMIVAGSPVVANEAHVREIDGILRASGTAGTITTASIHTIVDSSLDFDPRLATGMFVLRTHDLLRLRDAEELRVVTGQTLEAQFDASPPVAILTGFDTSPPHLGRTQDDALTRYARVRGYRAHALVSGGLLFLR